MIEGIGERGDGFRLRAIEHGREIAEQHGLGQLELRGVLLEQRGIGVEHADDLHVGACLRGAQEAADVPMNEAGDGEPHRRRGRRLRQGR